MQGFESVKDFSKEKMPEERAAAAQEIRHTRQEYFEKEVATRAAVFHFGGCRIKKSRKFRSEKSY